MGITDLQTVRSGMGIWKMIKILLVILFIFLLFAKPLVVLYDTGKVELAIYELGKSFFLTTEDLRIESDKIVEEGMIMYSFSDKTIFEGTKSIFLHYIKIISSLGLILFWLGLMFKLVHAFSKNASPIFKYSVGFFIFYIFQVIFLLIYHGAMVKDLSGLVGDNSGSYYMLLPFQAFISFAKAIPILLSPAKSLAERLLK